MLSAVFVSAALSAKCPSAPLIACGMEVEATAAASCDDVLVEMAARVAGQTSGQWHDPHNKGTYTVQSYGGNFSTSRVTGDGKYTDKQIFTVTPLSSTTCTISACSRSQVFSIGDAGTNYCDVKMLFCGSADGCKPVKNDFATSGEVTHKYEQSTVSLSACLKV